MHKIAIFAEDLGHEEFLTPLVKRIGSIEHKSLIPIPVSVRGGHGKVITELSEFLEDVRKSRFQTPDLIVVATDANCKGRAKRLNDIKAVLREFEVITTCAIPDPHIERWYLLDSAAFKEAVGKGCSAPDHKCARDRYKEHLAQAVRACDVEPILGGIEYATDIVNGMDIDRMIASHNSLSDFLGDFIPKVRNLR